MPTPASASLVPMIAGNGTAVAVERNHGLLLTLPLQHAWEHLCGCPDVERAVLFWAGAQRVWSFGPSWSWRAMMR
jgi:hypothetical protein